MKRLVPLLLALLVSAPAPLKASGAPLALPAATADDVATPIPFVSNGCSGFREARFFSCCYVHDFAYWSGGTWKDRQKADVSLRRCLSEISHDKPLAYVAFALVRMTTVGGAMIDFGWGRAWRRIDRELYDPITATQQRGLDIERRRVCSELTLDPKTNRYYVDRAEPRDDNRQLRPNQARQLCGASLAASSTSR
ncbi:MAG TPA: hypothetical protein VFV78_00765 [Vicinamibacterales bacterium]|nr:hypothetical protein [Vicinamibacterales bacterium]